MPNPKCVTTAAAPQPSTVPLLRRIWSGHLGALQLPPAETAASDEMSIVIDAGELGRVRIYYRRQRYRHYRNTRWMWAVDRAEPDCDGGSEARERGR
jgi:hypothetical protein